MLDTRPSQQVEYKKIALGKIERANLRQRVGFSAQYSSVKQWENILWSSIIMFESAIEIKADIKKDKADLGGGVKINVNKIQDQERILAESTGTDCSVWLIPIPDLQRPSHPLSWSFQVSKSTSDAYAQDLRGLIVPGFAWFHDRKEKKPFFKKDLCATKGEKDELKAIEEKVWKETEAEFEARKDWMSAACELVPLLLRKALDEHNDDTCNNLLSFMFDVAATTACWRVTNKTHPNHFKFRNALKEPFIKMEINKASSFIEYAAQSEVYIPFLSDLIKTSSGIYRNMWSWDDNPYLLNLIAENSSSDVRHHVSAAAILSLRYNKTFEFEAGPLKQTASWALMLLDNKTFRRVIGKDLLSSEGLNLAASPEKFRHKEDGTQEEQTAAKKAHFLVHHWAELLARILHDGNADQYDEAMEQAAVLVCLSALLHELHGTLPVLLRMRLLQAFSTKEAQEHLKNSPPQLKESLQHLLFQLLAHAESSLFEYYAERQGKDLDNGLLISLLPDDNAQTDWKEGGKAHQVADRLLRHRLVLKRLGENIKKGSAGEVFDKYRQQQIKNRGIIETDSVVIAKGITRPQDNRTIFRTADSRTTLDPEQMEEMIPCFVSNPHGESEFDCLVKFRSAPENTLNFHNKQDTSPEDRRERLCRRLREKGSVGLVGKVLDQDAERVRVDLGVDLGRQLNQIQELPLPEGYRRGNSVFVELQPTGQKLSRVRSVSFAQSWRGDYEKLDLRNDEHPIATLKKCWKEIQLQGKVMEVKSLPNGKRLICCDCGFTVTDSKGNKVWPGYFHDDSSGEPPTRDSEIPLPPINKCDIEDANAPFDSWRIQPRIRIMQQRNQLAGRELSVTLESERLPSNKEMRQWYGIVDSERLPILRKELTCDLRKLFDLDKMEDEDPILEKLKKEPVRAKVIEGGSSLSLLQASPEWRRNDIVLAVQAKHAESVAFDRLVCVGWQPESRAFLFEIFCDDNTPAVPFLGGLVLINEGEMYAADGSLLESDVDIKGKRCGLEVKEDQETHELRLCIAAIDDPTGGFRNAFAEGDQVEVVWQSSSRLELKEWRYSFPQPKIEREGKACGSTQKVKRWDPFAEAEEYTLHLEEITGNKLYFSPHSKEEPGQLKEYFQLSAGCWPVKQTLHFRYDNDNKGAYASCCYIGNFMIRIDGLMHCMTPELLTRDRVNRNDYQSIFVSIDEKIEQCVDVLDIDDVPYLDAGKKVYGLVIETPSLKSDQNKLITVRWIPYDRSHSPDDFEQHNDCTYKYVPTKDGKLHNGDILVALSSPNGKPELKKNPRSVYGNLLSPNNMMSFEDWCRKNGAENVIKTVLIQRPESEEETWQFVFPPAQLVEIPAEQINSDNLKKEDVWELDLIWLMVMPNSSPPCAKVERSELGLLHEAANKPARIYKPWYDCDRRLLNGFLKVSDQLPDIRFSLSPEDIPRGAERDCLEKRRRPPQGVPKWFLSKYHLLRDKGIFSLRPVFAVENAAADEQKPSLEDAMKVEAILGPTPGKVESAPDRESGSMLVKLDRYRHETPLRLPKEEQRWVHVLSEKEIKKGQRYDFIVFRNDDGVPTASLRRNSPQRLSSSWLSKHGFRPGQQIGTPQLQLSVYGKMTKDEVMIYFDEGKNDDEDVFLFEYAPGKTIYVNNKEHVKFYDEPAGELLHYGDTVKCFEVFEAAGDSTADQKDDELAGVEYGINILGYDLDILHEIEEFDRKKGFYFGSIRIQDDGRVVLEDVKGQGQKSDRSFKQERWELMLEQPDSEEIERLKDYDGYVYLKFAHADKDNEQLTFRLATQEELFQKNHLIFVRSEDIESYNYEGRTSKLMVKPLDRRFICEYFIPESQYSIRRGRLDADACKKIFLATVYSTEKSKLSLINNPPRRFSSLLDGPVAINKQDDKYIYIEEKPGVNFKIPRSRTDKPDCRVDPGDIILFKRDVKEKYRLHIEEVILGHRHFLSKSGNATFQTRLWSTAGQRCKDWENPKQEKRSFECDLIGFSQLRGQGEVSRETIARKDSIVFQTFEKFHGNFVQLKEGLGRDICLGTLKINNNEPVLHVEAQAKVYRLTWEETTFREGNAEELSSAVEKISWIDDKRNKDGGNVVHQTIGNTHFIVEIAEEKVSHLISMAKMPFPVEYLLDQFSDKPNSGKQLTCIVADRRKEKGELILEIAPGRFAVLPDKLIKLSSESHRPNRMEFFAGGLKQGDEITLQLEQNRENKLLPYVHITSVSSGKGRQWLEHRFTKSLLDEGHDLRNMEWSKFRRLAA